MPLPSWANHTVHVLEPGLVDDHGTQVADWDTEPASRIRVDGCWVAPLSSSELLVNQQSTEAVWRVLLPAGTPVTSTSRIEFSGVPHDVDGEPLRHPAPHGGEDHVEVLCRAWKG